MKIATLAVLAGIFLTACAATMVNPTVNQTQLARAQAVRVADGVTAGLGIVTQVGQTLDTLSLPVATRTAFDCAVLNVTGTSVPASAAVTAACGPVPLAAQSKLTQALTLLKTVSTCPSLQTTAGSVLQVFEPLIVKLTQSGNATLAMAGTALQLTVSLTRQLAGSATCSA